MKVVIDIPPEMWALVKEGHIPVRAYECIVKGIPLPKGHGRLIDADAFISKMEDVSKRHKYKELLIDDLLTVDDVFKAVIESLQNEGLAEGDAPTIIEAESEEGKEDGTL